MSKKSGDFTGNKGEWSEVYVLFKLLADGCLQGADENLNPDPSVILKVLKVLRGNIEAVTGDTTTIKSGFGEVRVKRDDMINKARRLYTLICAGASKASFAIPEIEWFLKKIGCVQIVAPSTNKRDITVQVEDSYTGEKPLYGFSIKSEVGCPPTLLNASDSTNLIYEVEGLPRERIPMINAIEGKQKIMDRCAALQDHAKGVFLHNFNSDVFKLNLQRIDDGLPDIVGYLLLAHYFHGCATVADAVAFLKEQNPKNYSSVDLYEVKVKRFLRQVSLGMTPATSWDDTDDATGGYIIVKADGTLVAFYIYNRKLFDEYLFQNTKFERGSTTRHKFMRLYEEMDENGRFHSYLKLNLQIRFI